MMELGFSITGTALRRRGFNPLSLSPNAFYMPDRADTVFSDALANVTAQNGSSVGAVLDIAQGSELGADIWSNPAPALFNYNGSDAQYDQATQTLSNPAGGGNAGYPRFNFPVGMTVGRFYRINGQLSGDIGAINLIRAATGGSTSRLDYDAATGVISGMVEAQSDALQFSIDGTSFPIITITSLTIQEVPGFPAVQHVSGSRPVFQTDHLTYDLVDDNVTANLPNLGASATVAYVTEIGSVITGSQAISGPTALPVAAKVGPVLYFDRALSGDETTALNAWLQGHAPS